MTLRPIEIVGGGLAGLTLGIALRREGIPVTVWEAGRYPRHRVCGEFIAGLDERTVRSLGVETALAGAVRHHEVRWHERGRLVRTQALPRPAWGLSRYRLDARLAEHFVRAGGTLRAGERAEALPPSPGRVLASGRRRAASDWIGLKVHLAPNGNAAFFGGRPATGSLEIHLGRDAYVGLSEVEHGRWNLCGLFRRQPAAHGSPERAAVLWRHLRGAGLDRLAERTEPFADPTSFCAVAGLPIDGGPPPRGGPALGDAYAMIAPFTGNGMAMALQSAELAAGPLAAYARGALAWEAATAAIRGALRRRFALRLASASALHPYFLRPRRQRWLAAAARSRLLPLRPLYAVLH